MTETIMPRAEWQVPKLLKDIGGRAKLGPIEIESVLPYRIDGIVLGEHQIVDERPTNTGHLFRFDDGKGEKALKTFLNPKHSYLDFSERWQRLWSIAAEFQTVARSQADWPAEERTHLGVVGVWREDDHIHISKASSISSESVEPGLLMRWLPEEHNLMNIFEYQNGRFGSLIPIALQNIKNFQVPLSAEDARTYCGADGVATWINRGNINVLRISEVEEEKRFASDFWRAFSGFVENSRELLDRRAITSGIFGNGDTKLKNAYHVGSRVSFIDPTTFLLKSDQADEGFVVAPFPFHDPIAELSYFTIYMRALEELTGGEFYPELDRIDVQHLRTTAMSWFREVFDEDVSVDPLNALFFMYEAGYASVEYEINLREARQMNPCTYQKKTFAIASALHDVAMEDISLANG